MKNLIVLLILIISFDSSAKYKVTIPAKKSVELTYEEFATNDVQLINKSGKTFDVSVIDPATKKKVSGYGMGPFGKTQMTIKDGHVLKLKNNSNKDISITVEFIERRAIPESYKNATRINFTLQNKSMKAIPLIIPDVMNPNLSALSNSGVSLRLGQQIFYKKGLKKILILTVDESIKEGDKIDVSELIKNLD